MIRRKSPHEILISKENDLYLGTLTPRAWHRMAVAEVRAKFFSELVEAYENAQAGQPYKLPELPPVELMAAARRSSGSIKGAHRKDLVEAIRGRDPPAFGVGLPQNPETNGNGNGREGETYI